MGGRGGGSTHVFFLNNLKTAHIRTLKLLHFFNIIAVNKLCKKKVLFDAKVRVEENKTAGSFFKKWVIFKLQC